MHSKGVRDSIIAAYAIVISGIQSTMVVMVFHSSTGLASAFGLGGSFHLSSF
jgi:hypothetical protein